MRFFKANSDTSTADDGALHPQDNETLAQAETRVVNILRVFLFALLVASATLASVGVYINTQNLEKQKFEADYEVNAQRISDSFHDAVERQLGSLNSMATDITSYALDKNQSFPFVTLPDFAIRGSDLRAQAAAIAIHWMPLVTDDTRTQWEEYALTNRFQIEEDYEEEVDRTKKQDAYFGFDTNTRTLQQSRNETILDDGSGYHARIFSIGAITPRGDEAEGSGPYLPSWQRR